MPRFFHRRLGSATPPQIADMPLLALRSQLYPVHPDAPAEAYAQQGQPLPIGLPQHMLFSGRGKRGYSGALNVQVAPSAPGYVSARDFGDRHSGTIVDAANIPPVIMRPASFATGNGATALTMETVDPDIDRRPMPRGYLPPDRYVSAADLNEYVRNDRATRELAQQTRNVTASRAIAEAGAVRQAVMDKMTPGGGLSGLPWYMRR